MASVGFDKVSKIYPGGRRALTDLSLEIDDGELLVLVGPSGCGKSTALRLLAGLDQVSEGRLSIGERVVNDLAPQRRNIAMVFQNYALYPHMTVRENMLFPLKMTKTGKAEAKRKVEEVAALLELSAVMESRPGQLSGGQRQRVAMGRAIVRDPEVFLLDEPLSNLDYKLRVQIRAEIASLQARMGATMIYVTHDQVEAMTLGQRVAVLMDGRLQQVAAPQTLYDRPENEFVARFIGSPGMNLIDGRLEETGDGMVFRRGQRALSLGGVAPAARRRLGSFIGKPMRIGIRAEALHMDGGTPSALSGTVTAVESLGHERLIHVDAGYGEKGALVARVPVDRNVTPGEKVFLAIDPARLYFFDDHGNAIY